MFKHKKRSKFNKQLRIGYLGLIKRYGLETVQSEASKIWWITEGEKERLKCDDQVKVLSTRFVDELKSLFYEWRLFFNDDEWDWITLNVFQTAELMSAITATDNDALNFLSDITPVISKVRKLTPRECGRLMGCDDESIDIIMNSGLSNSAIYKLFGNSIVVDVLFHIFRKMFIELGVENYEGDSQVQLSLF